jgi:putative flippase GtrA
MLKEPLVVSSTIPVEATRLVKFAGVGAVGLLVHYMILTVLVEFGVLGMVYASAIGFTAGGVVNYCLNYRYTFCSSKRHCEAMLKFFAIISLGLILNTVLMYVFTRRFSFHYLLAQIISTGVTLIWNFSGNRLWTFRDAQNATRA